MSYRYQNGDRPLDGYTIQYALGRGGFGEVYFAVSDSGREVALKAVQNYEEVELRGISHCMNLKSPHLVMIFDVKRAADGLPWVIMEYVNGPSLRDILDEAPNGLDIDQVRFFMRELCKGLSYLHEAGVVHRDLKPHNVFFEDGIVKIGDYSLSKVITNSHRSGNTMTVGSVHYMAPEISMGRYDKTVDIYALGCMLYEMLTGQPPHVGESMGEVLMKHLSQQANTTTLPAPFDEAVRKAMQREPTDRFATAHEFAIAIQEASAVSPMDSFHPATLSLAGQRTKAARQQLPPPIPNAGQTATAHTPPPIPQATSRRENPGLSNSTAPTMRGDTGNVPGSNKATPSPAAAHETSPEAQAPQYRFPTPRPTALERLGLNFRPSPGTSQLDDSLTTGQKFTMLIILCCAGTICLPLLSVESVVSEIPLRGWLAMAMGGLGYLLSFSRMMDGTGPGWSVFSRFVFLIIAACVGPSFINFTHVPGGYEEPVIFGILLGMVIPDWRCFLNPTRRKRFLVLPTLIAGACAGLPAAFLFYTANAAGFAGTVMLFALAMQATAPFRRSHKVPSAAKVAPPVASVTTTPKPKLAFDRVSILLEIVFLGCLVAVIGFFMEGDDELIAASVPVGMAGVYSLYLRLQRRVHTDGSVIPMRGTIFLDLLVVASTGLFGAMLFQFDDDLLPGIVIFGASTLWLGRLRFLKHKHRSLHRGIPPRINKTTAFCELVAILGILTAVALAPWFDRYNEYVISALASIAVAIIAIRIRMNRHLFHSPLNEGDYQ